MQQEQWTAVDRYLNSLLVPSDETLEAALKANAEAHLPAIDVAPNQGKLLQLLARIAGARRILEIGTLRGYSTIWLARALPDDGRLGKLIQDIFKWQLQISLVPGSLALWRYARDRPQNRWLGW
jgi:predicted O-methyltransferase YrrM